jgi:hypothetical protein
VSAASGVERHAHGRPGQHRPHQPALQPRPDRTRGEKAGDGPGGQDDEGIDRDADRDLRRAEQQRLAEDIALSAVDELRQQREMLGPGVRTMPRATAPNAARAVTGIIDIASSSGSGRVELKIGREDWRADGAVRMRHPLPLGHSHRRHSGESWNPASRQLGGGGMDPGFRRDDGPKRRGEKRFPLLRLTSRRGTAPDPRCSGSPAG